MRSLIVVALGVLASVAMARGGGGHGGGGHGGGGFGTRSGPGRASSTATVGESGGLAGLHSAFGLGGSTASVPTVLSPSGYVGGVTATAPAEVTLPGIGKLPGVLVTGPTAATTTVRVYGPSAEPVGFSTLSFRPSGVLSASGVPRAAPDT